MVESVGKENMCYSRSLRQEKGGAVETTSTTNFVTRKQPQVYGYYRIPKKVGHLPVVYKDDQPSLTSHQ